MPGPLSDVNRHRLPEFSRLPSAGPFIGLCVNNGYDNSKMTRFQLEHIIRAAAEIADDDPIIVIGSQAILGEFPDAPDVLLVSMEADVYPLNKPERADLIDGTIGEGSPFHELYGYYAQGVGPKTAILPAGWQSRLVRVQNPNTRQHAGLCLEVHDLVISKYVANRPKDIDFVQNAIRYQLIEKTVLLARLDDTPLAEPQRQIIAQKIKRDFAGAGSKI